MKTSLLKLLHRWETNANFALNIYENPYKWRVYAVYKGFFVGKL